MRPNKPNLSPQVINQRRLCARNVAGHYCRIRSDLFLRSIKKSPQKFSADTINPLNCYNHHSPQQSNHEITGPWSYGISRQYLNTTEQSSTLSLNHRRTQNQMKTHNAIKFWIITMQLASICSHRHTRYNWSQWNQTHTSDIKNRKERGLPLDENEKRERGIGTNSFQMDEGKVKEYNKP